SVQKLDIAAAPARARVARRAAPGSVKDAVREAISAHPDGISQQDIDSFVRAEQGITLKPSSRRMAIIKLHSEGVITERGNLWFPAHPAQEAGAQTPVPENG
ncbi:hypothetical protein, partial [Asticcacaulis sp.]|uniref:hypothetical protein n=1 Tax=Asticcacaulis sp. TaxID=1872648 RepID=UPI00262FF377